MEQNQVKAVVLSTTADLVSLEECMSYVKYEISEEDKKDPEVKNDIEKLDGFRLTALKYLKNATGKVFETNPLAKTYVLIYVNELFENYKGLPSNDITSTKNLLLAQLRYDNDL